MARIKRLPFITFIAIALLVMSLTSGCQKHDNQADIAAIKAVYEKATLAIGAGDVDQYMSLITEDAAVMASEYPLFEGTEDIRSTFTGLFAAFDLELPYTVNKVEIHGDCAFACTDFLYSITPKEGGDKVTRAGKELDIFKRQADGSWKIYIICWNYNAPPEAE